MIDLVSRIYSITQNGDIMRIVAANPKYILTLLNELGVTDIKTVTDSYIDVSERSDKNPTQRDILFEISCHTQRFDALKMLNAIGGFGLSQAERAWFKAYNENMTKILQHTKSKTVPHTR